VEGRGMVFPQDINNTGVDDVIDIDMSLCDVSEYEYHGFGVYVEEDVENE
jgi:hypothetical protein